MEEGSKTFSPAIFENEVSGNLYGGSKNPDEVAEVVRHLEHKLCMCITRSMRGDHSHNRADHPDYQGNSKPCRFFHFGVPPCRPAALLRLHAHLTDCRQAGCNLADGQN